jgi:hypothetical protein
MRGLALGSGLISLLGCGPAVAVHDDDAGASTSEHATDGGSSGDATSTVGPGATGNDDGSDGDDGSSSDTGTPADGLCGRAATEPLAVVVLEDVPFLLHGDGTQLPLDLGPIDVPAGATVLVYGAIAHGRAAVTHVWALFDGTLTHGSTVALFDDSGVQQWRAQESGANLNMPIIGADGSVVVSRSTDGGSYGAAVFDGGGSVHLLPDFSATGPRQADGLVPGMHYDGRTNTPGWMDPEDQSVQLVSLTPADTWYILRGGDIVYRTADALAIESPTAVQTIPSGAFAGWPVVSHAAPWLLLRNQDGDAWARLSLDEGAVEPIALDPPPGSAFLDCYSLPAVIDREGRVLAPTRDAGAASIHRLEPDRGVWTGIGEPVTLVDSMTAYAAGDTVFVTAAGQNTTFCPAQEWDPPVDALSGGVVQVVRPSAGVVHVLPQNVIWQSVDPGGTCVAYVAGEDPTVLLDVQTGQTHALDGVASVWFAADGA